MIVTRTTREPKLIIQQDDCMDSPRELTNLGYFITREKRYNSPDKHPVFEKIVDETSLEASDQDEHIKLIKESIEDETDEKVLEIYPIIKYEHGNVNYSLGTKQGWDHSNNGFYIVTDKSHKETGEDKKHWEHNIEQELKNYTQWANDEVYKFTLYNDKGEIEDACGGYFDLDDIKDTLPDEWKDERLDEYII